VNPDERLIATRHGGDVVSDIELENSVLPRLPWRSDMVPGSLAARASSAAGGPAAVDDDVGARDVGGVVGGEKRSDGGDLVGMAGAVER
jgi:hypothetical protein